MPTRYIIASDVCDKHPRDKHAMVWESFDGSYRELVWEELQDLANQAAHVLRNLGVDRGDRVAVVLQPTPETAAILFGIWKLGAILLSMSVLYGDDSIRHRLFVGGAGLGSPRLGRIHRHSPFLVDLHDKPARIGATSQAPQTSHLPKNDRVCVGAPFDRKSLGHLLLEERVKACLTCARRVNLAACHLELQVSHAGAAADGYAKVAERAIAPTRACGGEP